MGHADEKNYDGEQQALWSLFTLYRRLRLGSQRDLTPRVEKGRVNSEDDPSPCQEKKHAHTPASIFLLLYIFFSLSLFFITFYLMKMLFCSISHYIIGTSECYNFDVIVEPFKMLCHLMITMQLYHHDSILCIYYYYRPGYLARKISSCIYSISTFNKSSVWLSASQGDICYSEINLVCLFSFFPSCCLKLNF